MSMTNLSQNNSAGLNTNYHPANLNTDTSI